MTKLFAIILLATLALSGSAADEVTGVEVEVSNGQGCGGWCFQVVLMPNSGNCRSATMPADCRFSAGQKLRSGLSDCESWENGNRALEFQLRGQLGGSWSDWCASKVTFTTSDGKTYTSTSNSHSKNIRLGDWDKLHYAW